MTHSEIKMFIREQITDVRCGNISTSKACENIIAVMDVDGIAKKNLSVRPPWVVIGTFDNKPASLSFNKREDARAYVSFVKDSKHWKFARVIDNRGDK